MILIIYCINSILYICRVMKRILIFSLLLVYATVSCGLQINVHYCGGKLKTISFFNKNAKEKNCCGRKMKSKRCCNDKTTFLKVNDNHHSSKSIDLTYNHFKIVDASLSIAPFSLNVSENIFYNTLNYHAPPVLYDNPLYLKHRVLLI